jgi:hypothetical protein
MLAAIAKVRLYRSVLARDFAAEVARSKTGLLELMATHGCATTSEIEEPFTALDALAAKERKERWMAETPITFGELIGVSTLITFGSPLDKIQYFFRTKVNGHEGVRAHILNDLFGFRRHPLLQDPAIAIDDEPRFNPVTTMHWMNVSALMDPVSARLRFYTSIHEVRRPYRIWGACHTRYWHDPEFYAAVKDALKQGREANDRRREAALAAIPDL